jgi:hypothetical protein
LTRVSKCHRPIKLQLCCFQSLLRRIFILLGRVPGLIDSLLCDQQRYGRNLVKLPPEY